MDWYVVHVRWGCERAAAIQLIASFPLIAYCPEVNRRRQGASWVEPLFPGYLFVQPYGGCLDTLAIERTPGCGRFLRRPPVLLPLAPADGHPAGSPAGADGHPADGHLACSAQDCHQFVRVADSVLEELRRRLEVVNAAGGLPATILRPPAAGSCEQNGSPNGSQNGGQDDELEDSTLPAAVAILVPGNGHGPQPGSLAAALDGLLTPSARVQMLLHLYQGLPPAEEEGDTDEHPVKRRRRTRGKGRWIHYH